jgi:predicted dehydrogenase
MPRRVLRLAVVGTGFGRYGLVPAFRQDPRCEIVALLGRSGDRTLSYARDLAIPRAYSNWNLMVRDGGFDAVAIAVPPAAQTSISADALNRGIPVFAEKPLAATLAEADSLASLADASGLPNMIDFMFPELDTWRQAREILSAGELGTLRHFAVDWRMESYDVRNRISGWKTDEAAGGGVIQHFGSHVLYYVEHLLGPVEELTANLASAPEVGRPGDTFAALSLYLRSGVSGSIVMCSASAGCSEHRFEVYGSEGTLRLVNRSPDPVAGFELYITTRRMPRFVCLAREVAGSSKNFDSRVGPVSRLASRFTSWCLDGIPANPTFSQGSRVQCLLEFARLSSREACRVQTPLGSRAVADTRAP